MGKIELWGKRFILTLFIPLSAHFVWTLSAQLTHRENERDRAAAYSESADQHISQVCHQGEERSRLRCAEEVRETYRERQRREAEVGAQRETADWTMYAVIIGFVGLFVSIGGVWLLLRTIHQGQEANALAAEAFAADTRPVLAFKKLNILIDNANRPSYQFLFENVGNGPAYISEAVFTRITQEREPNRSTLIGEPNVHAVRVVDPERRVIMPGDIYDGGKPYNLSFRDSAVGVCSVSAAIVYSSALTDSKGCRGRLYTTKSAADIFPLVNSPEGIVARLSGTLHVNEVVGLTPLNVRGAVSMT